MASRKLSDSDKKAILELYRQPGETTSTLAERYGVSNSTISRFLKTSFSEAEYEALIQQKRGARSIDVVEEAEPEPSPPPKPESKLEIVVPPSEPTPKPERRSRRRSSVPKVTVAEPVEPKPIQTEIFQSEVEPLTSGVPEVPSVTDSYSEATALQEMLDEDLLDQDDDLDDDDLDSDLDDDLDDDDLDDDDLDGDLLSEGNLLVVSKGASKSLVQVLPLTEASLPRTCYLVVDRSAELIARPLRDFGDLGQIPEGEIQEKTLPVFDNHRVAKRYSNPRTQRVIKLPDSRVLQKTSSHLQAKGITRLLIDGQVYSLN